VTEAVRYLIDGLVLAALLAMTAAIMGLWRLRGFYNRLHANGLTLWLGLLPLLVAALLSGDTVIVTKSFLLLLCLLMTTPVSSHTLARAAGSRVREPDDPHPEAADDGSSQAV